MRNLDDYIDALEALAVRACPTCHVPLIYNEIQRYDHSDGWPVRGFREKQWLYVVCNGCHYEWAIWKLFKTRTQSANWLRFRQWALNSVSLEPPCECGAPYLIQGKVWWCPGCKENFVMEMEVT